MSTRSPARATSLQPEMGSSQAPVLVVSDPIPSTPRDSRTALAWSAPAPCSIPAGVDRTASTRPSRTPPPMRRCSACDRRTSTANRLCRCGVAEAHHVVARALPDSVAPPGSPARCSVCHRQRGGQPPLAAAAGPAMPRRRHDARVGRFACDSPGLSLARAGRRPAWPRSRGILGRCGQVATWPQGHTGGSRTARPGTSSRRGTVHRNGHSRASTESSPGPACTRATVSS